MGDFGGIVQQGGKSLCLIDVKVSLIYFLRASEYILGNFEVKKNVVRSGNFADGGLADVRGEAGRDMARWCVCRR